jgi:S1-C subfamily serine protease
VRFLGWGSGTIVDPQGFILTNHHVTDVSDLQAQLQDRPDVKIIEGKLAVFITTDTDSPPVPTYIADVVADDAGIDLAVVKISEDLSGHAVDNSSLNLPSVALGDSSKLKLGQQVHIFGYPAIGGETITFTSGDISGFTYQAGVEGRAWIKTSASISGGNSGGTAIDDQGNLIGVPTQSGSGSGNSPDLDCRPENDTNGDGKIDDNDVCVPIGGFINALRPVDLAKPLITQATNGIGPQPTAVPVFPTSILPQPSKTTLPRTAVPGTVTAGTETPGLGGTATPTTEANIGQASVSRVIIANGIADSGYPVSVVKSLPSGAANLVCYFDFSGFETGHTWQMRAFIDGEEVVDAWPADKWDAETNGSYGTWWFGWLDATDLADGTYKMEIDYDGQNLGSTTVKVGGADTNAPAFSNVTFESGGTVDQVLPADITDLTAHFDYANMTPSTKVKAIWYNQDETGTWNIIGQSTEAAWTGTGDGTDGEIALNPSAPLAAGTYRVELLINGDISTTSDVWLTGGGGDNGEDQRFGPITFATELNEDGTPLDPATEFETGTSELYGVWDYSGMANDLDWNVTWLLNDEVVVNQDDQWQGDEQGTWSSNLYMENGAPLPTGKYEMQLSIQGTVVQTATATIGDVVDLPTPTPAPDIANSVIIKGTITDSTSGKPIEGAVFAVLVEGVTWDTFDDTESQILDMAFTDSDGKFQLTTPLPRGHKYSLGAFADGYTASASDDVEITDDLPSIAEIDIKLQQER